MPFTSRCQLQQYDVPTQEISNTCWKLFCYQKNSLCVTVFFKVETLEYKENDLLWYIYIWFAHFASWQRNLGIILKKSSDYEVMTRFFIGFFGRNFNPTSGETFSGVEWYTRLTPVGAFERKSYNIAQCLHILAGLI